jgi:hypothetical protein
LSNNEKRPGVIRRGKDSLPAFPLPFPMNQGGREKRDGQDTRGSQSNIAPEYELQIYGFKIPNTDKTYFFIVNTSTLRGGFGGINLRWQKFFQNVSLENYDYAIIILKSASRGFLIPSKDFEMLKPLFSISHDSRILLEEKSPFLSKYEFFGWKNFFQLLNL